MAERLVDVMNSNKTVLHTYPITIGAPNIIPNDTEYKAKAMKAAAHAQLVPDANLNGLTTRMHVSRGGGLAPYGDDRARCPKRSRAWTRLCANAHTFFGRRTAVRTAERRKTDIALMTSIYASVPTFFGNKRGARKDGPKNSGTRAANSRCLDLEIA